VAARALPPEIAQHSINLNHVSMHLTKHIHAQLWCITAACLLLTAVQSITDLLAYGRTKPHLCSLTDSWPLPAALRKHVPPLLALLDVSWTTHHQPAGRQDCDCARDAPAELQRASSQRHVRQAPPAAQQTRTCQRHRCSSRRLPSKVACRLCSAQTLPSYS
jgi:hypothetical protein